MHDRVNHGKETYTQSPEKIEVIGHGLPALSEAYERLSDEPDIRVRAEAEPFRKGSGTIDISEKQLIDDLLDFCSQVKQVKADNLDERERALVASVDGFVDSIHFLTHEAYEEAAAGLAERHSQWLREKPERTLKIVVHDNKKNSSQQQVAADIHAKMLEADPSLIERVDVGRISEDDCNADRKVILADDWSVSGNLMAQDVANVYRATANMEGEPAIEVNLMLAREDQVGEGIRAIDRLEESYPGHQQPEIIAYFSTPAVASVYGHEAIPSGSHSSVDYGFAETLGSMYRILERHGRPLSLRLPYAAVIVPTYAYDYEP